MKKILVVLLILAVTAGAFAQDEKGTWSVSGNVDLESTINGAPGQRLPDAGGGNEGNGSTISGSGTGSLTLNYDKELSNGGFGASFTYSYDNDDEDRFSASVNWSNVEIGDGIFNGSIDLAFTDDYNGGGTDNDQISLSGTYTSDLFGFGIGTQTNYENLMSVIPGGTSTYTTPGFLTDSFFDGLTTAYGWFKLLGGDLTVSGSYIGDAIGSIAASNDAGGGGFVNTDDGTLAVKYAANGFEAGISFPSVFDSDGDDFMRTSIELLAIGAKYTMDDMFEAAVNFGMTRSDDGSDTIVIISDTWANTINSVFGSAGLNLYQDININGDDEGEMAYLEQKNAYGVKLYAGFELFMLGDLSLGGSFLGTFWNAYEASDISFGIAAGYAMGDLGLSLGVKFQAASIKFDKDAGTPETEISSSTFSVTPGISYDIIPGTLSANLDLNIEFNEANYKYTGSPSTDLKIAGSVFEVTPKVTYTVAPGASMFISYTLGFGSFEMSGKLFKDNNLKKKDFDIENPTKNEATIGFSWSF